MFQREKVQKCSLPSTPQAQSAPTGDPLYTMFFSFFHFLVVMAFIIKFRFALIVKLALYQKTMLHLFILFKLPALNCNKYSNSME